MERNRNWKLFIHDSIVYIIHDLYLSTFVLTTRTGIHSVRCIPWYIWTFILHYTIRVIKVLVYFVFSSLLVNIHLISFWKCLFYYLRPYVPPSVKSVFGDIDCLLKLRTLLYKNVSLLIELSNQLICRVYSHPLPVSLTTLHSDLSIRCGSNIT